MFGSCILEKAMRISSSNQNRRSFFLPPPLVANSHLPSPHCCAIFGVHRGTQGWPIFGELKKKKKKRRSLLPCTSRQMSFQLVTWMIYYFSNRPGLLRTCRIQKFQAFCTLVASRRHVDDDSMWVFGRLANKLPPGASFYS